MSSATPVIDVDLDTPPELRWGLDAADAAAARELLAQYVTDLGGTARFADVLDAYAATQLRPVYFDELRALATRLGTGLHDVLLSNLYYDALKVVLMACTAFAVDTPEGPLHARNLDWSTQADALARHTRLVRLTRGGRPRATLVGWPGFTGCFSGVAPGRFAVTLNAVLSDDPPQLAASIVYTLRELLEEAASFREAVDELARRPIATDALLLVTGIAPGEMAVIERTPTRAAVRGPENGVLVVTNDYRDLSVRGAGRPAIDVGLATTACGRFDRAGELARRGNVQDVSAAMAVLRDPQVVLGITVQHMVLRARDGLVHVEPRLTASGQATARRPID